MPTCTVCAGSLVSAKPSLVTRRSYVPGGTVGNVNRPTSFVVVFVVEFVETSVSLTLAPGMAAPVWSVTCPTMTPVAAFCAQARAAPRPRKIRMHIEKTFFEDLMLVPPCLKENGNPPAVSLVPHRRTWRVLFKIQRLPRLSTLLWKKEKKSIKEKKRPRSGGSVRASVAMASKSRSTATDNGVEDLDLWPGHDLQYLCRNCGPTVRTMSATSKGGRV